MKKIIISYLIAAPIWAGVLNASAAPLGENFSSPNEAVSALGKAAAERDLGKLGRIFGPAGKEILSSGDAVSDQAGLARFDELFREKHSLEAEGDARVALLVGGEDWPFPVPLVKSEAGWAFDATQGKEEILNRRIGRNELTAISVSRAFVEAQKEYAEVDRDGDGFAEYAQVVISSPGRKNGLFWPRRKNEAASPFGPMIAKAALQGYSKEEGKPTPYYGYLFRILKSQGPAAPGGKKSYISAGGRMTEGFALLAYPVEWGNSGIMTFIVGEDGDVYQRDLGPNGPAVKEYNPDQSWSKAEPQS